jgi:hypothetical protein
LHSSSSSESSVEDAARGRRKEDDIEVTEGYRLYLEKKRQRRLEEKMRAAAYSEGMEGNLKLRKVELKDFPNHKRKLVV